MPKYSLSLLPLLLLLTACAGSPPPKSEYVTEGAKVGEVCQSDVDCALPTDYAIRSSCAFSAQCVEGKCAVTCVMLRSNAGTVEPLACTQDSECDCKGYVASDKQRCACLQNECVAIVKEG